MYRDLPRGRKRPGWKREFTRSFEAAAQELSGVTESQIEEAIRGFRAEKKQLPEIMVRRIWFREGRLCCGLSKWRPPVVQSLPC